MTARSSQALRDSYGALSWHDYWHGKLAEPACADRVPGRSGLLDPLVGPFTGEHGRRQAFAADFFALLPSLHLFVDRR